MASTVYETEICIAVQEKLENCSFGGGNGHETLQTTTPTEPGQWRHDTETLGSLSKPRRRRKFPFRKRSMPFSRHLEIFLTVNEFFSTKLKKKESL